ncbi:UNVERIFIED_CONTAM: hypothetical protein NCL1_31932 [Trichonephila clavipes]
MRRAPISADFSPSNFTPKHHVEESNPIRCDKNLKWISKRALPKTFSGECNEPSKLKNKSLRILTPADFH